MFKRLRIDTPYPVGPVHLYVFERSGGLFLFDAGPPTQENYAFLKKNIALDKLKYLFITHSHADHGGGAQFIAKLSNARILMPKKDILKNRMFDKIAPHFKSVFSSLGFPNELLDFMFEILVRFKKDTPIPDNVYPIEDEKLPQGIEFIPFPGHSITDFVYIVDKKYAVTGDFLLNGIFQTPLIEIDPETMTLFNNYEAYCKSISKIGLLDGLTILPSHSEVASAKETVAFYIEKILNRSTFVSDCIKKKCSVFDAVRQLTNPYDNPFKAYLKASEIVFFKSFVENPVLLKNAIEKTGLLNRFQKSIEKFL